MIAGISIVKNEADVIEKTIRWTLGQVDFVIVCDNGSTDGTREILEGLPIIVTDDPDPAFYQGRKMTALAQEAAEIGADWVVPFDADERWVAPGGNIADLLASNPAAWIYTGAIYEHPPVGDVDGMGWRRRESNGLVKVAARTDPRLRIAEGNHTCDYDGEYPHTVTDRIEVHHFPYRSEDQFLAKVRRSAAGRGATDLPDDVAVHYRTWGPLSDEELRRIYREELWMAEPDGTLLWQPL